MCVKFFGVSAALTPDATTRAECSVQIVHLASVPAVDAMIPPYSAGHASLLHRWGVVVETFVLVPAGRHVVAFLCVAFVRLLVVLRRLRYRLLLW